MFVKCGGVVGAAAAVTHAATMLPLVYMNQTTQSADSDQIPHQISFPTNSGIKHCK